VRSECMYHSLNGRKGRVGRNCHNSRGTLRGFETFAFGCERLEATVRKGIVTSHRAHGKKPSADGCMEEASD